MGALIFLGAVAFMVLVTGVIVVAGMRSHARYPTADRVARATGEGQWYAKVGDAAPLSGMLSRAMAPPGVLRVGQGQVSFTPDGQPAPQWAVPAASVGVRSPFAGAAFTLRHPELGDLDVYVSTVPGAPRRDSDDIRAHADRRAMKDVIAVLQGWGAASI